MSTQSVGANALEQPEGQMHICNCLGRIRVNENKHMSQKQRIIRIGQTIRGLPTMLVPVRGQNIIINNIYVVLNAINIWFACTSTKFYCVCKQNWRASVCVHTIAWGCGANAQPK